MICRNLDFFALGLVLLGMSFIEHLPRGERRASLDTIRYRIQSARYPIPYR